MPQEEQAGVGRHLSSDKSLVYDILDAASLCHVAFTMDGRPLIAPMAYGRQGDQLYIHGAAASPALGGATGHEVCVCVTHLDGVVYARSLFNHTMNYRCARIRGVARPVRSRSEKLRALRVITDSLAPGQWSYARRPTKEELDQTTVLALALDDAMARCRAGPPIDEVRDLELGIWAGVLPVTAMYGVPEPAPSASPGMAIPEHVLGRATRTVP
jgi:nitroimidazol reductase NimA-like FMN-containing flavoprotein (pyridoxamine 5'-phosphate oxidase superfamily)